MAGKLAPRTSAPPEQLSGMNAIIDRAASDAGRSPQDVRRLYNISGSFAGGGSEFLQGPPKVWAEQLTGLALDEGISGVILTINATQAIAQFAAEVVPAVRELVAAERAGGGSRAVDRVAGTAHAEGADPGPTDSGTGGGG